MDYFLDLENHSHVIIDYLRGYSLEDISLKYNIEFETVDKMIDLYNHWYN